MFGKALSPHLLKKELVHGKTTIPFSIPIFSVYSIIPSRSNCAIYFEIERERERTIDIAIVSWFRSTVIVNRLWFCSTVIVNRLWFRSTVIAIDCCSFRFYFSSCALLFALFVNRLMFLFLFLYVLCVFLLVFMFMCVRLSLFHFCDFCCWLVIHGSDFSIDWSRSRFCCWSCYCYRFTISIF